MVVVPREGLHKSWITNDDRNVVRYMATKEKQDCMNTAWSQQEDGRLSQAWLAFVFGLDLLHCIARGWFRGRSWVLSLFLYS